MYGRHTNCKFKIPQFNTSFTPPSRGVQAGTPPPIGNSAVYAVGELDMANLIRKFGAVEAAFKVYDDGFMSGHNFGSASNPNVYSEPPRNTPNMALTP